MPPGKRVALVWRRKTDQGSQYYRNDRGCIYTMSSQSKKKWITWTGKTTQVVVKRKKGLKVRKPFGCDLLGRSSLASDSGVSAGAPNAEQTIDEYSEF